MRVLIVDDDRVLTLLTRRLLEEDGFAVDVADTRVTAQTLAMVHEYDGIVLDLGLPDGNGVTLIQDLRRQNRTTPILVLSASTETETTVRALDAGADDFQSKPIVGEALKARVRALVRRGGARRTEQLVVGNLVLNRLTREVLVGGESVKVTARELSILEHLLLHAGQVVTRSQMLEKVFDLSFDPGTNVIDVNVSRLRRKLSDAGATAVIEAKRGIGFILQPPSGT
jgi:DNA-binding response OmpR family regulator